MKVGIVIQHMSRRNGGVYEAAKLACQALTQSAQFDFEIFTTRDEHLVADTAMLAEVPIHGAQAFGSARFGLAPAMVAQLAASRLDLLIVHGIWTAHALAAWIHHRRTGCPVIVVPHGMLEPWILKRSPMLKKIVWKLYLRDLMQRAASVQVLTEAERSNVQDLLWDASCTLIPNFVSNDTVCADSSLPPWWQPSDGDKTVFLFFGRIHEKKGVVELCEAWRRFSEERPDLARSSVLIFCGWNDGVAGFEAVVAHAGAKFANARFAGPQYGNHKQQSMNAATFMLLPSKSEGLPMTILEGWSLGLPAIMTEACNLDIGFESGAAIRTGTSSDAIFRTLVEVASMPEEARRRAANAGLALVVDEFSKSRFVDRMTKLMKAAASR